MRRGNLKPAHTGYRYQDIISAYYLINAVVGHCESVTIDKKRVEDDRIDDLEIRTSGQRIRRQIKCSKDPSRALCIQDFIGANSSLRIDRLVLTHVRDNNDVKEYRLCATWTCPKPNDELLNVLEKVNYLPSVADTTVKFYKLKPTEIWPEGKSPIWSVLTEYDIPNSELSRRDFIAFCEKFYIELELPLASEDLRNPGPIESSVLNRLSEQVGIGIYPNAGRQCEDVAALAIALATLARTQEATLLPKEISRALEIRTDFGRVSQAFPLDKNYFFDRPNWRECLRTNLNSDVIHILTAPPGAGKSWELTCLSEEFSSEYIVARHYCYLEPGDELVERRVTRDVFFANIIAELREVDPELCAGSDRLSADIKTLEEILEYGSSLNKKIVLIIDGLDHISRVKSASNLLNDEETDIIESIATLRIPPGVKVIIGSQTGSHLEPLLSQSDRRVRSYELSLWSDKDIVELAKLYRVEKALALIGIKDPTDIQNVFECIAERSGGIPLYTRYLCKGLSNSIESGDTAAPEAWLSVAPKIDGNISNYYRHLYDNITREAQVVADLFGVLDFSVSEEELKEILPKMILSWVPFSLNSLSPVLVKVSGQGGMRIFHESFRRFMLDELARKGRSLGDILAPVIDWLETRGFFVDAKCYRFLLPALRKSEKSDEIFSLVETSFVSQSVSSGHPKEAIQRNLSIVADIAGRLQNWPVLVRCAELRRSLATCFDIGQNYWKSYWESYCEMFGVDSLTERLLFDGKPTLTYDDGLHACLLVDDLGGTPPWTEYLKLNPTEIESGYGSEIDHERELLEEESLNIAEIQGQFRKGGGWRVFRRFYRFLSKPKVDPKFLFIRKVTARFCKVGAMDTMKRLASRFELREPYIYAAISLGIVDELNFSGEKEVAKIIAEQIINRTTSSSIVSMCLDAGADLTSFESIDLSLDTIEIGVGTSREWPERHNVRKWVSNVRLIARIKGGLSRLQKEINRVRGVGWYRCWLRYVLALYEAEALKRLGLKYDFKVVFSILEEDVHPFTGKPRACDLYRVHGIIKETIAFGLSLLENKGDWEHALNIILTVSNETSTSIDREDGGPVSIGTVIELIQPYASSNKVGKKIYQIIEEQVEALNLRGSYYSTHAEYTMKLASVQKAYGDIKNAERSWKKVGAYLAGYGWRKDTTLFDIIETIPVLQATSNQFALQALEKIQPLITSVLIHTDGRSTNRTPNAWFNSLLSIAPASAIEILNRTLIEDDGIESWPTVKALKSVSRATLSNADPILVNALWETIWFKVEYESEGVEAAEERLKSIRKIYSTDSFGAFERLNRLAAAAANDANHYNYDAVKTIEKFGQQIKYEIQGNVTESKKSEPSTNYSTTSDGLVFLTELNYLPIPKNASFVDILSGLRTIFDLPSKQSVNWISYVSVYLSYRIDELLDSKNEAGAHRILHFYAREIPAPFSSGLHPLGKLAQCLENAGHSSLAAIAYSLAYTQSRGGGGWYGFGDKTHGNALAKAISLDEKIAKKTVSESVSYRLRYIDHGAGISKGLMERIWEWGDIEQAAKCWEEAYNIISHRLPLTKQHSWFATFKAENQSDYNIDEALVSLLLVRLIEPRVSRRLSSLYGLLYAVKHRPNSVIRPLESWIARDTPLSSLLLFFQLLLFTEEHPYFLTNALSQSLNAYATSDCWGMTVLARKLLERIGVNVSSSFKEKKDVGHLLSVSKDEIEDIFKYDQGGLLRYLSHLDSKLPERVCKVLKPLLTQDIQIERIKERLKLSFGSEGKGFPPTEVIYWQFELFQAVLNEQAHTVRENLWKKGQWNNEEELRILLKTQPDIALHLAIYNSRIPRPALRKPTELQEGVSELSVVQGDPRYQDWFCLGYYEEQFFSQEHSFSRPEEQIKIYSGAIVAPIGASRKQEYFPFLKGDYEFWWGQDSVVIYQRPHDINTQLLSTDIIHDWMGRRHVLIPPAELCALVSGIISPEFGEGLVWRDSNGHPIVACRFWHVKGQQFGIESPCLVGCDLVVRPDILKLLEKALSCPIKKYTTVEKSKI